MATIKPAQPFNVNHDVEVLRKAMKGFGTDEQAIIDVICRRTNSQRQEIKIMFHQMYDRDLISDLKSELGGSFEDISIAIMLPFIEYDARELKRSMRGLGTDEDSLIEIMCTRTNTEILHIKEAYKEIYSNELENDIADDTSGDFKRLMISLCSANRQENTYLDIFKAKEDAKKLYNAGERKIGTDENKFISVLGAQSHAQINGVVEEYNKLSEKTLMQAIESEFSGDIQKGLLAILKIAKNVPAYFAERLNDSIVGNVANDRTLIRVIVTRCEVDMIKIKEEFQKAYGKSLISCIKESTSGDYKKMLLGLVG